MEVVEIEVGKIHPNNWNVNRMTADMRRKLTRYLKRQGLVEPLVVRPHADLPDQFELLGGEHRWRICKEELGYDAVPCVLVEGLDEKKARILSINLNEMSGESVPALLSRVLNDLQQDMPIDDMAALLPYDEREIQDTLALMQLPESFGDELEEAADAEDREAPGIVTLVFDPEQRATFDRAMEKGLEEVGKAKDAKARAAVRMAEAYLGDSSQAEESAGPLL